METKVLGYIEKGTGKHQSNLLYDKDGLSSCICAVTGVKQPPTMIIEEKQIVARESICLSPKGFDKFVYEIDGRLYLIRIRKLTPKECWRLMNFTDEDYEKAESVNSQTQLYKEAGNAIVVSVLMAIFSQLGIAGVKKWNEMTDDERYDLILRGCVTNGCNDDQN